MVKNLIIVGLIFMIGILVIPSILVTSFPSETPGVEEPIPADTETKETEPAEAQPASQENTGSALPPEVQTVSVFRSSSEMIEEVPLEEYIAGVVASEMPASYEMEALKAQALTARTYLFRQIMDGHDLSLPEGADVTDTVLHQVFKNEEELIETWGGEFEWKMSRIRQAVYETEGQVITFEDEPITATFFSTSNGYTENSEEYWESEFPYLRSVESPWDVESPRYKGTRELSVGEFQQKLQVELAGEGIGEIESRTTGGRVAKVTIGGKTFSGREIRDALELDSSDFSWERQGDRILIETRGWGHGVGMSQFGADGMAKEGYTYRDIIQHYYHGVSIEEASAVLVKHEENENLADDVG